MERSEKDARKPCRSVLLPGVKSTTVNLDEHTFRAIQREAARRGTTQSEFMRNAFAFQLGWVAALRAVNAGLAPELLLDEERLTEALAHVVERANPPR